MSGPVVLAAGGTGGHIFPAQALAAELMRQGRTVALITDRRGTGYEDRFPGVDIFRIRAATFTGKGLAGKLGGAIDILAGIMAARRILRQLKAAVVVGFGGYPSLPTMLAAAWSRLPTVIHEQNAVLGRVNRLLAARVGAIATSFAETRMIAAAERDKVTVVGNPVRQAIVDRRQDPYRPPERNGPIRLLVLGGSQGATVFSDIVPPALAELPAAMRARLHVTQQCRAEDLERVGRAYREAGIAADLADFVEDVPAALSRAHLVISRSGASTVCEVTAVGRPALFVPYPHATDDHQTANARTVADAGGARVIPHDKFTMAVCRESIDALAADPHMLSKMAAASRRQGRPDAARALAGVVTGRTGEGAAP
jgi:UDP-N-acetylglucosamine--N-acetylmuramyl-(pentapeptide) pyrophosphoryl-undecaprenol N-acetylglucosamine transferase